MKEYTTPAFAIKLCNADWLISNAKRSVVSIKGNRIVTLESDRHTIVDGVLYFELTQGETGALGNGQVDIEVTITCNDGFTAKSPTMSVHLDRAIRRETT